MNATQVGIGEVLLERDLGEGVSGLEFFYDLFGDVSVRFRMYTLRFKNSSDFI